MTPKGVQRAVRSRPHNPTLPPEGNSGDASSLKPTPSSPVPPPTERVLLEVELAALRREQVRPMPHHHADVKVCEAKTTRCSLGPRNACKGGRPQGQVPEKFGGKGGEKPACLFRLLEGPTGAPAKRWLPPPGCPQCACPNMRCAGTCAPGGTVDVQLGRSAPHETMV